MMARLLRYSYNSINCYCTEVYFYLSLLKDEKIAMLVAFLRNFCDAIISFEDIQHYSTKLVELSINVPSSHFNRFGAHTRKGIITDTLKIVNKKFTFYY